MSEKKITIRLETKDDYRNVENLTREAFWNVYRPGCMEHYEVDSKEFLTKLFEAMCDELPSPKRKNNGIGGITDELYSDHKRKY